MGLDFVCKNIALNFCCVREGSQLGDSFLSCCVTFSDVGIALHLKHEDVVPALIRDETAKVNFSKDAWFPANYSQMMKADDFDPRNLTFAYMVNHFLLCLLSQYLVWVTAELKFLRKKDYIGSFQSLSEEIHHREFRCFTWICTGWTSDLPIHDS